MSEHSHDHDAVHGHEVGHCSHSHRTGNRRRLLLTLILAGGYMIAEIIGGLLSNSLALLADAGHMASDVASLALSAFAIWLAERPADTRRTFGYHRAEILAALANAAALIGISIVILLEAVERLAAPPEVQGPLMMGVATGGLLVNIVGLMILHGGRKDNLNVRGAWLHVLSDALGSVAAIAAGAGIQFFGWYWADPVMSFLITLLIAFSSWRLLKDSVWVLMEGAPSNVDVETLKMALSEPDGVVEVHDLHVWTITSGLESLSCHVVSDDSRPYSAILTDLRDIVHDRFHIDHVTIQIEPEGFTEPDTPV